jgi:hypothetical protein
LNYEHPFPRVLEYKRVCDIMEVDITEFRVYKEVLEMKMCQQYKVLCFILSSFMDGA